MKTIKLKLDSDDARSIKEAIAERDSWEMDGVKLIPPSDSNREGAILAEICRGWLEQQAATDEPEGTISFPG